MHHAQEARSESNVGRDEQKVVDVSHQELQQGATVSAIEATEKSRQEEQRSYGLVRRRERQPRLFHVAVEQAAQQTRQDRPLRNARLLPIQPAADLLEGQTVISKQANARLQAGNPDPRHAG